MNQEIYSSDTAAAVSAPSFGLLLKESRVLAEMSRYYMSKGQLNDCAEGQGQPLMLIPGFGGSDKHMKPLKLALKSLGFAPHGWGQGYNWGMRPQVRDGLAQRLQLLQERYSQKVALVGWSLGGVFAREIARHQPEYVSMVFTMGSPINGHPNANNVARIFNLVNPRNKADGDMDAFQRRRIPPPVPCVAMHSKTDGIVAWQCAREVAAPNTENVEVKGSHFGLPCNPQVVKLIAERLSAAGVQE